MVSDYLANGGAANVRDCYDCEPLFTAVKYDRLEIARLLLDAGGDLFHTSGFRGDAFGAACWNWSLRMIDFCVEAGADVNEVDERNKTILDGILDQRWWYRSEDLPEWQKAYDHLVSLGARRFRDLEQGS